MIHRPDNTEYAPYYDRYISLVPAGDLMEILRAQPAGLNALLGGLTDEKARYAYAPGKWTIKEVLGHLIDTERVFAYRALRIGRNDKTALPGFEQDGFVANTDFNRRDLKNLLDEFSAVRLSNIFLFGSLSEEEWRRSGTASDNVLSARAAAHIVAGHVIYHVDILKMRYL